MHKRRDEDEYNLIEVTAEAVILSYGDELGFGGWTPEEIPNVTERTVRIRFDLANMPPLVPLVFQGSQIEASQGSQVEASQYGPATQTINADLLAMEKEDPNRPMRQ